MPPYLITNTHLFTGASLTASPTNVLIANGHIQKITPTPSPLPQGTIHIDGTGTTLLPGLIDAHAHPFHDVSFLERALRYGVTTVIDLHNEPDWFRELKHAARSRNDVADIKSACYAATVRDGWPGDLVRGVMQGVEPGKIDAMISNWPDITHPDAAEDLVVRNIEAGASYIKLYQEPGEAFNLPFPMRPIPTPSMEVQRAVVRAAHKHNALAVGHAIGREDTMKLLEAGVDGLAHSCAEPVTQELIDAFKRTNAFVIPTLVIHASGSGEEQESRERFASRLLNTSEEKEQMCKAFQFNRPGFSMRNASQAVRALKDAGVDIVCGTDSSNPFFGLFAGVSVHHEVWLYVHRCGLTPLEALQSATSVASRRLQLPDRGMVREGLLADLVLVRGDPTRDIDALADIVGVWRNGEKLK